MSAADLPLWAALLVSALLLIAGALTLIGALGLVRLPDFYSRAHAPSLATTGGLMATALACCVYFSVAGGGLSVYGLALVAFVWTTAPAASAMLMRAARKRDASASEEASGPP
jgi:multicomponent K+:H+ antiporter subunit G